MDRREFLGSGVCAAAFASGGCASPRGGAAATGDGRRSCPFGIGVAGYTLVNFSLDEALKMDMAIDNPRIAVLSLNPHCGDNGLIGTEEQDIIIQIIRSCFE